MKRRWPIRSTAATATLALLVLVDCGAVTQDLGSDDDASAMIPADAALFPTTTATPMDSSTPGDSTSHDTAPPADSRAGDACDGCSAPDGCVPTSCSQQGKNCGPTTDGCGHALDCGVCLAGEVCVGAGVCQNTGGNCTPETCVQKGILCGPTGDGCGNLLQCGTCMAGQICGGAGMPNHCGSVPDAGPQCVPQTCQQQSIKCGPAGDGCGGLLQCGTCTAPLTCGGGGPGVCG